MQVGIFPSMGIIEEPLKYIGVLTPFIYICAFNCPLVSNHKSYSPSLDIMYSVLEGVLSGVICTIKDQLSLPPPLSKELLSKVI